MKRALITGITGQRGSYLTEFLWNSFVSRRMPQRLVNHQTIWGGTWTTAWAAPRVEAFHSGKLIQIS